MANSSHSPESLNDILAEETILDYDSDTVAPTGKGLESNCPVSRVIRCTAPNPIPDRSIAHALTSLRASISFVEEGIITNRLDEKKSIKSM